jgi:hypothetical protein
MAKVSVTPRRIRLSKQNEEQNEASYVSIMKK